MHLSRHTIVAPIPDRDDVILIQPMSGEVALLEKQHLDALAALPKAPPAGFPLDELRESRFVVDDEDQDRALMADAWTAFLEENDRTPTQLILVPSFGCNLRCTYCYQDQFDPEGAGLISAETVNGFFEYVDRHHGNESPRPYVTLFGGEPLLNRPKHRERITQILEGVRARKLTVAAVTNGYDLESYVPLLAQGGVREIQVTLDGPPEIHDARRPHAAGTGTFDQAVRGIEALIAAGIPVNLRVVADKENLEALPALARFAEERGWLDLPESHFKTQIGRNYELFGCTSRQRADQLFNRTDLWARFVELSREHPVIHRFHKPRFHGMRHLAETGEFPAANFDACPAAKKEWAFGPDGMLYGCTATVGHPKHRLGRFHPAPLRDEKAIATWRDRNVCTIPECQSCALATVCGGGCGALAFEHHGKVQAPDCRPVRELVGLGVRYYGLSER